jgi:hypothetical protein
MNQTNFFVIYISISQLIMNQKNGTISMQNSDPYIFLTLSCNQDRNTTTVETVTNENRTLTRFIEHGLPYKGSGN